MNELLTRKQVAEKFSICLGTLRNWEKKGQITPAKRIGRRVYFTEQQINTFLNN
jgi:DNA-binding transcriptional MerR regulator